MWALCRCDRRGCVCAGTLTPQLSPEQADDFIQACRKPTRCSNHLNEDGGAEHRNRGMEGRAGENEPSENENEEDGREVPRAGY